jgi:hypothetical protein
MPGACTREDGLDRDLLGSPSRLSEGWPGTGRWRSGATGRCSERAAGALLGKEEAKRRRSASVGAILGRAKLPVVRIGAVNQIVRFYRIVNQDQLPFPNAFPFEDLQDAIEGLDDQHAYLKLNEMELLGSSWRPRPGAGSRRRVPLIALDRITRNPQLRIERRRHYRPLILGEGENLADPTFYAIFDDDVIGVLRTSNRSPGPASFRDYINHLEIVKPPIAIVPLVDANAIRALDEIETLTKFTVRVLPDAGEEVFRRSRMIYDAIRSARQNLGSVTVEITVRISPKGQAQAAEEARQEIANIVTTEALGHIDKATIRYRRLEDGKADGHNFLQEVITQAVAVELDTETGQPVESSVAEAMAAAYDSLYDDIRSALRTPN